MKNKLAKIIAVTTRGAIVRSKSRWYKFEEKKSKYFYNLEKRNRRKKNTTILCPREILEEEANFFLQLYDTKKRDPNQDQFQFLFDSDHEGITPLATEKSDGCEGLLSIDECTKVLSNFSNNKTPYPMAEQLNSIFFLGYSWNFCSRQI